MLHLHHRSFRTALVAAALSSSLAIGIVGTVAPAAAATPGLGGPALLLVGQRRTGPES
jgi:hypothetical protein